MILEKIKTVLQNRINKRNQKRLKNLEPCLVCSNCTGGFIYHWLGLRFNSPFINLYLTPEDFIIALENWDEFISCPISEINTDYQYPVGQVVIGGVKIKIHFMHYPDFSTALKKWNERKKRMVTAVDKIGFMLTNWEEDESLLQRFENLPFKHKVAFADKSFPYLKSVFTLKGFEDNIGSKNIYATYRITGERYIDQFDYVSFINSLQK